MKSYIKYISVIDKNGHHHFVEFYKGLNIITGKSSTGKSAMIEIFDYCFGNSEYTVPEGVITEVAQLYFVVLKIAESYLIIGRKPNQEKGFIKIETNKDLIKDITNFNLDYFTDFVPLTDFKKELNRCFGIDIVDTDTDLEDRKYRYNNKKKESPSARHFTSFMLQHQNLIANKHSLFYRFDEKEKRDQTIDQFKIFAGFVDQNYYIKTQKLNELLRENKKLLEEKSRQENYQSSISGRLKDLLDEYLVIAGVPLIDDPINAIVSKPISALQKIMSIEIFVDEDSDENIKSRNKLINERNLLIAEKRRQQAVLHNINNSIDVVEQYQNQSNEIDYVNSVKLHVSSCPFCETPNERIVKEANDLTEAISWLNNELSKSLYMINSFKAEGKSIQAEIKEKSKELNEINSKINAIDSIITKLEKNKSLSEQALKSKFRIESLLEEIKDIKNSDIGDRILQLNTEIEILQSDLKDNYNSDAKIMRAEKIINTRMKSFGANLDFEPFYKPINLKFSLETFDLYHEMPSGKKIYLRSMGSGANWLYSHLALFTSLQYFFCSLGNKALVPPILFIDQPSQVYFPNNIDNKDSFNAEELKKITNENSNNAEVKRRTDEDLVSVTKMFNELINHCEYTEEHTGITPQIIVTDHADHLVLDGKKSFEDLVAGRRWRGRGFIKL